MHQSSYIHAIAILHRASTPMGFTASAQNTDNYKRIWTRDGILCGLAALSSEDEMLIQTFRNTIQTIVAHQHVLGFIPSNVEPETQHVSYGGASGRTDNAAWLIIGICAYLHYHPSETHKKEWEACIEKALEVYSIWEFNGRQLMYVPQSGNWADEYYMHGYLLFDQLLRMRALEMAADIFHRNVWKEKAKQIREIIQINYHKKGIAGIEDAYMPQLKRRQDEYPNNYWIAGFNPGEIYTQFDLAANSLAIHFGIGNEEQIQGVLKFISTHINNHDSMLPSFYPFMDEGSSEMRVLEQNYAYRFRNQSGSFHNGGLWPIWNGLLCAVLKEIAPEIHAQLLTQLLFICRKANQAEQAWEFNECYHGITQQPEGIAHCSWSAAGLIIAQKGLYGI